MKQEKIFIEFEDSISKKKIEEIRKHCIDNSLPVEISTKTREDYNNLIGVDLSDITIHLSESDLRNIYLNLISNALFLLIIKLLHLTSNKLVLKLKSFSVNLNRDISEKKIKSVLRQFYDYLKKNNKKQDKEINLDYNEDKDLLEKINREKNRKFLKKEYKENHKKIKC